ncbi:MAG: flagellar basal body-associated protein FliL [Campylobacterota bacterium]|nr:flagellar basal body-associated protein FliL [Campylobacterota bacterium]
MAEEESTEEEGTQEKKKSSNMLMIIIIVVLILIILGGIVVALLMMGGDDEEVVATQQNAPQAQSRQATQPRVDANFFNNSKKLSEIGILYPLDSFTINLKSDAGRRYLKTTISLELEGEELSLELDANAPVLRDRIIRILTSKTLEEISSKKGKQKVTLQIIDTLNAMLSDGKIQGIYFTEFVIQ